MTGRGLTKLHKLPAGPTLYTNQIPEKEVKPSILRRQVTGDPMARKLFSSKKEVTFRSGWTHGVSISENVKSKLEPHQKKAWPHIGTARAKLQGVAITRSVYNVRQSQFQSNYFFSGNQYNVELF